MKWLLYLVLAVGVAFTWNIHFKKGKEMDHLRQQVEQLKEKGDSDSEDEAKVMEASLAGKEGERTFTGILLTFLGAGLVGIFFVVTALPFLAQSFSQGVIGSDEKVDKDAMREARSLVAQGDYAGAIAAFQQAATVDPLNRLPWVEIAKIQKDQLEDPKAAIQTIRLALESQEWEINDAAYFLFRLAELYNEVDGDRASAVAIMNQVIEQFPETRHSANASHKLHEWSVEDAAAGMDAEEAEFLARQQNRQS